MSEVRGCNIPDDLYYWVEKHVWVKPGEGGSITVGMTDVAQNLAAKLVAVTPKKVGKTIQKGKSVATVESGKFVGPVPAPVTGEITEVNSTLISDPELANRDPYGEGWIVKMQASDWAGESGELPTGQSAVDAYNAFMEQEGISCG
ncbi:MAG: glycine cleavage system protein GcvH [Gemmatimonadota bacterium]|nr:glycine cleavage system protein GcvH [Gemmatimonadota bacterium]